MKSEHDSRTERLRRLRTSEYNASDVGAPPLSIFKPNTVHLLYVTNHTALASESELQQMWDARQEQLFSTHTEFDTAAPLDTLTCKRSSSWSRTLIPRTLDVMGNSSQIRDASTFQHESSPIPDAFHGNTTHTESNSVSWCG